MSDWKRQVDGLAEKIRVDYSSNIATALKMLAKRVEAHESALDEYADALDGERLGPGIEFAVKWLRERISINEARLAMPQLIAVRP